MFDLWLAVYRHWPKADIICYGVSYEEVLEKMKAHKHWDEKRYEKRGPSDVEDSHGTYWDKAFPRKYPSFEIFTGRGTQNMQ